MAVGQIMNGPARTVSDLDLVIVLAPIGTVVLIVARVTIVGGATMTVIVPIAGLVLVNGPFMVVVETLVVTMVLRVNGPFRIVHGRVSVHLPRRLPLLVIHGLVPVAVRGTVNGPLLRTVIVLLVVVRPGNHRQR